MGPVPRIILRGKMGIHHRGHREHRGRKIQDFEGLMGSHLLGETSLRLVRICKPLPLYRLHSESSVSSVVHFGFQDYVHFGFCPDTQTFCHDSMRKYAGPFAREFEQNGRCMPGSGQKQTLGTKNRQPRRVALHRGSWRVPRCRNPFFPATHARGAACCPMVIIGRTSPKTRTTEDSGGAPADTRFCKKFFASLRGFPFSVA